MTDIRSLDDAVAYLRERMERAGKSSSLSGDEYGGGYNQGQYDAFGEAIEAITGKPAQEGERG